MTKSKNQEPVKTFFDNDSVKYLEERYPIESKTADQYSYLSRKAHVLAMLDKENKKGGSILDIGCGPGVYTKDLLARGWKVWSIDLSSKMLKTAKDSLSDFSGKDRATFAGGVATHLPFQSSFFDQVICIGVVSYIEDIRVAISEITRVLKPEGTIIFQISNKCSPFELEGRAKHFLRPYFRKDKDEDDLLREKMNLIPYNPSVFDGVCSEFGLKKDIFCYYDFRISLLARFFPMFALTLSKKLEILNHSSVLGWMGAGYLVKMKKINSYRS